MKEYKSIMTRDNKYKVGYPTEFSEVSETIHDYENNGWHLHTYQTTFVPSGGHMTHTSGFYHHLLFEKEKTA